MFFEYHLIVNIYYYIYIGLLEENKIHETYINLTHRSSTDVLV